MTLAIAGVTHERRDHLVLAGRERGKADVDRELTPVTAPACELEPEPHRTGRASLCESLPVALVNGPEPLWHEHLDAVADDFLRIEAEQRLDGGARQQDDPVLVDHDHGVR